MNAGKGFFQSLREQLDKVAAAVSAAGLVVNAALALISKKAPPIALLAVLSLLLPEG
jgi:hypothetical protein